MKLYYFPLSGYSQKTLVAMYEKNVNSSSSRSVVADVPLRTRPRRPSSQKVNRLGKVPFLYIDEGDWKVAESSIIIEYIDRHVALQKRGSHEEAHVRPRWTGSGQGNRVESVASTTVPRLRARYVNEALGARSSSTAYRPEGMKRVEIPYGVKMASTTSLSSRARSRDLRRASRDGQEALGPWAMRFTYSQLDGRLRGHVRR